MRVHKDLRIAILNQAVKIYSQLNVIPGFQCLIVHAFDNRKIVALNNFFSAFGLSVYNARDLFVCFGKLPNVDTRNIRGFASCKILWCQKNSFCRQKCLAKIRVAVTAAVGNRPDDEAVKVSKLAFKAHNVVCRVKSDRQLFRENNDPVAV